MILDEESKQDLTREKSLWEVYLLSRRVPQSWFNRALTIIAAIGLAVYSISNDEQPSDLGAQVMKLVEIGFGFTLNVLGFLVAGFTIFATISKPELLLEMQTRKHPRYPMSWLKYNFAVFFRVFGFFLAFAGLCSAILILGQSSNFWRIVFGDSDASHKAKIIVLKALFTIIGTGWIVLLLLLKSFIFNIYHVVMTSLRWEAEKLDPE